MSPELFADSDVQPEDPAAWYRLEVSTGENLTRVSVVDIRTNRVVTFSEWESADAS